MMNASQLRRQSSSKQARYKRVRTALLLRNDPNLVKLSIGQANLGTALVENHVVSDVDIDVANILSLADRRRGNWLAIEPLFCYLQACRGCPLCSCYRQQHQTGGTNAATESTSGTSDGALHKVKIQCSLQDTDISGYERSRQRAVSRGRYWIDNFQIVDQMLFALAKHPHVSDVELHISMRSHLWALKHFLVQTAANSSIDTLTMIGTFTSIAAYEAVAEAIGLHTTALTTLSITSAQPRRHLEPMLWQLHNCRNLRHLSLEFVNGHLDGEVDEDIDESTSYPLLLAALAANTNLESLNLTVEYLDRLTTLWEPLNDHSKLHQCKVWVRQQVDPNTLIQAVSASTKLSHLVVELDKHQMNAQSWHAVLDAIRTRAPSIQARLSVLDRRLDPGSFEFNTSMSRIYISPSTRPGRDGGDHQPQQEQEQHLEQSHSVHVEYPGCFISVQLLWRVLGNRDSTVPVYMGPRTPSLTFAYIQNRYELTAAYCMGFDSTTLNFLQPCQHLSKLIVCNTDTVSVQSNTSANRRLTLSPRRQLHRRWHRQMPALVPLVSTFLRRHESVVDLTLSGFHDEQVRYLEALVERNRNLPRLLRCYRSGNGLEDPPLPPVLDNSITTAATMPPPPSSSTTYPTLFGVSRHTPRATSGHVLSGLLQLSHEM